MARKHFPVEQIINYLREADVMLAQGRTAVEVCRHIGVSEQTYYRWRKDELRSKSADTSEYRNRLTIAGAGKMAV